MCNLTDKETKIYNNRIEAEAIDVQPIVETENMAAVSDEFICKKCGIYLKGYIKVVMDEDNDGYIDEQHYEYEPKYCPECGAKVESRIKTPKRDKPLYTMDEICKMNGVEFNPSQVVCTERAAIQMVEYISKQGVIDYLNGYLNSIGECGADSLLFDRGQRRALTNSIQDILAVKSADVQPVKHGRWIDCTFYDPYEKSYEQNFEYKCSCCGHMIYNKPNDDNRYCGHCGARMDGGAE